MTPEPVMSDDLKRRRKRRRRKIARFVAVSGGGDIAVSLGARDNVLLEDGNRVLAENADTVVVE